MDSQTTAPQTPAERATMTGQEGKQAAKDVAATAGQEAQRTTREAKDQARQLLDQTRSGITEQASAQQTRAASGLRQLSDQLGSMAQSADQDGPARGIVEDVARRAGEAASWLDARDPGSILEEARDFARRRPGTFLALAAGIGVVAGRMSRSLVDESRDSGSGSGASTTGVEYTGVQYTGTGTGMAADYGYGTGSLAATGVADTGMPSATSPTTSTTGSLPVTPGASPSALSEGMATVPSGDLPGPHGTTQPLQPDGTPSPIDETGHLTALDDDTAIRGER
jgi:ElaB/YqjD/DUF883 family membrane-anchored ribosome-binding protein